MTDGRRNRPQYAEPGSMARIFEAAVLYGTVDTDRRCDPDFERAKARLTQAVNCRVRAAVERLVGWQRKGGRARWSGMTPEQRSEAMRRVRAAATSKHVESEQSEPKAENQPR